MGGITPYGLSTPEVPTEFLPSKGTEEKDDPLYLSLTSGNMWEADDYPEGLGTIEDVYFKADEDVDYDPDYDFGHVFDESLNICDGPVNPPLPWPLD